MADSTAQGSSWRHFIRHFLEMVVAMLLGMAVLGAMVRLSLNQLGYPVLLDQTETAVAVMATNMTVGMTLLMRYRGHSWPSIAEMAGAMYVPFIVLLVPFWLGLLPGPAVMAGGHVLMLPCMALVMLRRRREYAQDHRDHQPGRQELRAAPAPDQWR
jgi:magnesium-transporting ATPase (P-type)